MSIKTYNLFISHSWTYSNAYNNLTSMLDEAKYFDYKNYSVPKDDPIHNASNSKELYEAIKNQVKYAHVVIILAGVYSSYSKWIDKEIEIAQNMGKPILAVEPWGSEKTSSKVKNAADRIVKWNTDSIVNAIRELSL
ncbi:MAG: TIR domain-containing protein [Clostridia bacterium]|nr:TIR domain-containing protein [Clostridia bacterium]